MLSNLKKIQMSNKLKHIGLFEGIGGFSLAARWAGWETVAWCEWNEFGQKVLRHHFPEAEGYGDITKTNFKKYANTIDILTGGFPCQPYSLAGKRKGKEDERHLWPEMLRAIREIQPSYVVGENVGGLINWNGGMVFDEVQIDLEAEGYEVLPFLLPACAKNAPHRRDRIWFIAYSDCFSNRRKSEQQSDTYQQGWGSETDKTIRDKGEQQSLCNITSERTSSYSNSNGLNQCNSNNEKHTSKRGFDALSNTNKSNGNGDVADTNGIGNKSRSRGFSEQFNENGEERRISSNTEDIRREDALENGELERGRFRQSYQRNAWDSFPSVSPICNGNDGISNRLDSITFPKWRNESIKAGGNAIVPHVAYEIFKVINQMNETHNF
jgi:DNA (cytosine-5)-methyltransferase 1